MSERAPSLIVALVVLAAAIALPACLAPATEPTSITWPSANSSLTPEQAAEQLRRTVTEAKPLLIVTGIPSDWSGELRASASAFRVSYRSRDNVQTLTFAIALANIPFPGPTTTQTHPAFHGDPASLYQVADSRDPSSARWLMWTETGTWSQPGPRGVPYLLSATGLTDQEFWKLAATLHPNQI